MTITATAPLRDATAADIVKALKDSAYPMTAVIGIGWGLGPAQNNIGKAIREAVESGRVILFDRRGKQMVKLAPLFTLTYDTAEGKQMVRADLPAASVQRLGKVVMAAADRDMISNIAVTNDDGDDVTFNFACFQG